ncbi:hypothetical protein ACIA74_42535 [Streptomyces sp. NPDC051658]|uniref:hypothetical protein n=1 Tax=Streptomyces sp. NPDC051658 TaxID=3365667 RepID=UPI0037B1827C
MTDDFAAISSASLAGLLLLCVLEFYSMSKWGMDRLSQLKSSRQEEWDNPPADPFDWADIEKSGTVSSTRIVMWAVTTGAAVCAVMAADLVLITLWAAVDSHGPARWLAWSTVVVLICGLGSVLTYIFVKMATSFLAMAKALSEISSLEVRIKGSDRHAAWLRDPEHVPHHPAFDVLNAMRPTPPTQQSANERTTGPTSADSVGGTGE